VTDLVIDASVVIKWVIEEDGTREALSLLRHRLFAPELLAAECANALWKKTRRSELTPNEAGVAARLLQRADIELAPMRALFAPAAELAIELDHPAYNCIYLALAEALSCDLVTADYKLSGKALPARYKPKVLGLTTSTLP
jgi:predicted nucleic acid-binding protein